MALGLFIVVMIMVIGCAHSRGWNVGYFEGYKQGYKKAYRQFLEHEDNEIDT